MTTSTHDVPPDGPPDRPVLNQVDVLVATFICEYPTDPVTVGADSAH